MRRLLRVLAGALIVAGCSSEVGSPVLGPDAGVACKDDDHDGFGENCSLGLDCDDHDSRSTNECRTCAHPELGCPCATGQQPISCFGRDEALIDGNMMCHEGTRSCRDGVWSACEDMHGYVVTPDRTVSALINPDAAPLNCSICDRNCFKITDPLLEADGGPDERQLRPSGGLHLAEADGGTGMGGTADGGVTYSGCTGLSACCSTIDDVVPQAKASCNDRRCRRRRRMPSGDPGVLPEHHRGAGQRVHDRRVSAWTVDCDGIPGRARRVHAGDDCEQPALQGNILPLATTNNQAIFHILDKGETGSNSLEIGFQVQNADIYFLMDMSGTMAERARRLVNVDDDRQRTSNARC